MIDDAAGAVQQLFGVSRVTEDGQQLVVNWVDGYTAAELREKQMRDPHLQKLLMWAEAGKYPTADELAIEGRVVKLLYSCRTQLEVSDGVLYYRWCDGDEDTLKLVVPQSLRMEVLKWCHDSKLAGHLGQYKTVDRVKQSFYWPEMARDVKKYILECHDCQMNKKATKPSRAALGSYHAGCALERVHIDILGPFPESTRKNKYLLMVVDQFTKWVEAYPLPDQKAEQCAREFLIQFCTRLGYPLELHSDQGTNFMSDLFSQICQLLEITRTRTTPYHPAGNGQVERYNRTLLAMIRCYINQDQRNWDEDIYFLTAALRATPQASTGLTPNLMMLGREVNQPVDVMLNTVRCKKAAAVDPHEYVFRLQKAIDRACEVAREHLRTKQARQKRLYDLRKRQVSYERGDLVAVLQSARKRGRNPKLDATWLGPYVVQEVINPVLYRLAEQRRTHVLHHDRLKPYRGLHIPHWVEKARRAILGEVPVKPPEVDAEDTGDYGLAVLFGEAVDCGGAEAGSKETDAEAGVDEELREELEWPVIESRTTRAGRTTRLPARYRY